MVGILVQIKGASCVAFVCVKSGKVVSSTLIIKKKTSTFRQCCLHQGDGD